MRENDGPRPRIGSGAIALAATIFGAAMLVRLAVILRVGFHPEFFDVDGYHALALVGLDGRPVPTGMHPPGYSWFLLALYHLVGPRPRIAYLMQAILSSLAATIAGEAARRRWGTKAGLVAGLAVALDGHLAIASSVLAGESLALFGVTVALALLVSRDEKRERATLAVAAFVIGLTALVRTAIAATLAVPIVLAFERPRLVRSLVRGALLGAIGLAPLLLFAAVRADRTGSFRVGSPWDVVNFWIGNNPAATGRIDPMPEPPGTPSAATELDARADRLGPEAKRWAVSHPLREAELVARRASYLFAPAKRDVIYIYGNGWAGEQPAWLVLTALFWSAAAAPLLLVATLGALALGRDDRSWWMAVAFLAAGALPYLVSIGDARFLLPFHGVLAFTAAALFAPRAGATPRWKAVAATLLGIALVANAVHDLAASRDAIRAVASPGGSRLRPPYHFGR